MLIKHPSDIKPSEITPEPVYNNRREFLRHSVNTGLFVTASTAAPNAQAFFWSKPKQEPDMTPDFENLTRSPFSTDEKKTTYEAVTTYNNFIELGPGKSGPARYAKYLKPRPWSVTVDGAVAKPGEMDIEDILKLFALEERIYRLRCVETWAMVIPWVGFPLSDLLKRFEPTANAKYVRFETLYDPKQLPGQKSRLYDWPYVEGLRLDEAMHPLTILSVGLYDKLLPNQNGAPLRLVVPWKYGFKSIKSIVRISLVEKAPDTTWMAIAPDEYGFYANVNPEVSHPRWSQRKERRIGEFFKRDTLMFNGYAEQVADLYAGMDLKQYF